MPLTTGMAVPGCFSGVLRGGNGGVFPFAGENRRCDSDSNIISQYMNSDIILSD